MIALMPIIFLHVEHRAEATISTLIKLNIEKSVHYEESITHILSVQQKMAQAGEFHDFHDGGAGIDHAKTHIFWLQFLAELN